MADLISLEQAQALVLERARALPAERVGLADAAGRYLAEDARAAVDLPPFASSAMDGYALRAVDTPGALPVVFRIAAGLPAPGPLGPGEAMAIATGGVVPDGADVVVQHELTREENSVVQIDNKLVEGTNVRPRGGDVRAGDVVADAGTHVRGALIGALAAAGVAEVHCARRPRVRVLTTGTELRRPGEPLQVGEVYEANGAMLAAQLSAAGADVEVLDAVADDERAHREAIAHGLEADVLVTSGGVSVGPHDLVRRVEEELGVEEVFWRVSVKPGKPVSFGARDATLVFGLPGNPVSSLVGCELFVKPALRALQGAADPLPVLEPGALARGIRRDRLRTELVRARLSVDGDRVLLDPVVGQESHMIVRSSSADALVLVEPGDEELPAGGPVKFLRL